MLSKALYNKMHRRAIRTPKVYQLLKHYSGGVGTEDSNLYAFAVYVAATGLTPKQLNSFDVEVAMRVSELHAKWKALEEPAGECAFFSGFCGKA